MEASTTIKDFLSMLTKTVTVSAENAAYEDEIDYTAEANLQEIRKSLNFNNIIKASPFQSYASTPKSNRSACASPSKSPLTRRYFREPDSPVSSGLEDNDKDEDKDGDKDEDKDEDKEDDNESNKIPCSFDTVTTCSSEFQPKGILKKREKSRFSVEIHKGSQLYRAIIESASPSKKRASFSQHNKYREF